MLDTWPVAILMATVTYPFLYRVGTRVSVAISFIMGLTLSVAAMLFL